MIFSPYRYPPAPIDASQVEYTPADLTDWGDADPGRVKQALDVLAARGAGDGSLTADELAAIQGAATPSAKNPFATIADTGESSLTGDQVAAITRAATPSASNVFATIADLPANELSSDELAAIENAATAPTETNPFLTVADILPVWTLDVVYNDNEVVVNPTHGIYRCISGGSTAVLANKPGVGEDWETVWELVFEGGGAPAGSGGIDVWLPPVGEGVEYAVGDFTVYAGSLYHCTVAHTSSAATTPGTGEDWETVWELVLSPVTDAADITYTPTTAADWSGSADPGDLDDALDQLAGRTADLEAAPPAHAASHATGQADAISYSDIGAAAAGHDHSGVYQPVGSYLTSVDAADATYTPATATDWNSDTDPGNVDDALDQLASRVDDLEAVPVHDALSLDTTVADVFGLSTQALTADDAGADKLVFWDESGGKLTHATIGSGLTMTDTTLTAAGASGWTLLGSATASASAQIQVDNIVSSAYDLYQIVFDRIAPATDNVSLELLLRSSAPANIGGTYKTSITYCAVDSTGAGAVANNSGTNGFLLSNNCGSDTGENASGSVLVYLATNSAPKIITSAQTYENNSGVRFFVTGGGYNSDTTAVAGFGMSFASGNIASGVMRVYGLKNS